ncbi:MAG: hypothetical protein ACI4PG_00125 [Candidatus Ventricola sp.]
MDRRMKEKLRRGSLTDGDVRRLIDWQLTQRAEAIDSALVLECLLFLYPDEPGLPEDGRGALLDRLWCAIHRPSRVIRARHRLPRRTVLLAALLALLLAGAAIAATLGLFGYLRDNPSAEMSRQRLEHLDEKAPVVGQTVVLHAPTEGLSSLRLETDYDQLAAHQYTRSFELTVDQAYCDGKKLYYSYTLREPNRLMRLGEGMPTGFDEWDWTWPGEAIAAHPNWSVYMGEAKDAQARAWMADGEKPRYVIYDTVALGDGADLCDGTEKGRSLNIFDSAEEWIDADTRVGFQQVDLPEDYVPGDTIDFLLSVTYGTTVLYQDGTGSYQSCVRQAENRGFVRAAFTAQITGETQTLSARASFADYAAEAQLTISDVDISGRVLIDAPEAWVQAFDSLTMISDEVYDYVLLADGQRMPNVDGGYGIDRDTGKWVVHVRYDLPPTMEHLTLVPIRLQLGETTQEQITLR